MTILDCNVEMWSVLFSFCPFMTICWHLQEASTIILGELKLCWFFNAKTSYFHLPRGKPLNIWKAFTFLLVMVSWQCLILPNYLMLSATFFVIFELMTLNNVGLRGPMYLRSTEKEMVLTMANVLVGDVKLLLLLQFCGLEMMMFLGVGRLRW